MHVKTEAHPRSTACPSRGLVATLLTLAVLTAFVGTLAVWVNRQALNTRNWTNTSGRLLADPQIQEALGDYLVAEALTSVGVSSSLGSALPAPAAGLAAPLTTGLRSVADRLVPALLATNAAQRAWRAANRQAHAQLMRLIDGGGTAVSTHGGVVTLDLRPLVELLVSQVGLLRQLGITVPSDAARIVIMRSNQLKTAQDVAAGIRGLAVTFTIVPLALCALALWVADGWRRIVLRRIGWCCAGLGVAVLLARRLLGNIVIDALVNAHSIRGAGLSAWLIGTSLLRDIAVALTAYGLIIVCVSWLAGETTAARRLRRLAAPVLVDRPVKAYALVVAVILLLVLWGPSSPLREPLPIIGVCVLGIGGVEALRRQTRRERVAPTTGSPGARRGSAASPSGTPRR